MTPTTSARLSRARAAVTVAFIVHGLVFSSWLPYIPLVKESLGLSAGGLGLLLLAPPAGAIAAMPLTGAACSRWGSGPVTRATLVCYAVGMVAIGAGAGARWSLALALVVAGMCVGAFDVAMNAQAAVVERAMGKPVMGSFHATWSLAAGLGAAIGGLVADAELLTVQLALLGLLGVAGALPWFGSFIPDGETVAGQPVQHWRFERGLVLLAVVAFAGLLAEGAAADWSAVFLSENQDASTMVAGWAYAVFAVAMFAGRLVGDRLVGRFGRSRSIAAAAFTGGGGMSIELVIAGLAGPGTVAQAAVIAGLAVLGLGIAVIVPVVFSSAGDGPGIAMVSTGGYSGWLLGPAIIGGLGEWLGLSAAIWAIPVLAVVAGAVAPVGIRALRSDLAMKVK